MLTRRVPLRRSLPPQRRTPLQPGKPPERRVPIRKKRSRPRRGPERSPEYLAWIRTLPCAVCAKGSAAAIFVEAAHTNAMGGRGLGQKASDFSAIPLCCGHHRENPDSYHVWARRDLRANTGSTWNISCFELQSRFWHVEHGRIPRGFSGAGGMSNDPQQGTDLRGKIGSGRGMQCTRPLPALWFGQQSSDRRAVGNSRSDRMEYCSRAATLACPGADQLVRLPMYWPSSTRRSSRRT